MSEHTVAEYGVHIHGAGPPAADSDPGGLDVLRDFAVLAEPLRSHIEAMRGLLAEAEPFDNPDDVPVERCLPILAEGRLILAVASIEGLSFVLATIAREAGERALHHVGLVQRAWCELPCWGGRTGA